MGELIPFPTNKPMPEAITSPYYYEGPVDPLDIVTSFLGGFSEFAAPVYDPGGAIIELSLPTLAENSADINTASTI